MEHEQPQYEREPDFIQTFDELMALGGEFGKGTEVSFQPWGRYDNERQVGTVRIWEGENNIISINFMGSKVGIKQPDNERIKREQFEERKDIWKIQKIGYKK